MEIRYRVFHNRTLEDITGKYQWVITPEGKLCTVEYDDVPEMTGVHFELLVKRNGTWEVIE